MQECPIFNLPQDAYIEPKCLPECVEPSTVHSHAPASCVEVASTSLASPYWPVEGSLARPGLWAFQRAGLANRLIHLLQLRPTTEYDLITIRLAHLP